MLSFKPFFPYAIAIVLLDVGFQQLCAAMLQTTSELEFELPGVVAKSVRVASAPKLKKSKATIVVFVGTECPLAKLYASRLDDIESMFNGQVRVVGVSSNQQDSLDDLKRFKKNHNVNFPIGKDFQNKVADRYGATRTPEVVLLDNDLKVKYRGRIDDQYSPGISREEPNQQFLVDAIELLLRSKPVVVPKTDVVGCLIGRIKVASLQSEVTYTNQVSRILQKHCIECHRSGEIGPFSLTDYEEVVGWADMMVEVIAQQRMPPWHANPNHGEFKNSRLMTSKEKELLEEWAASGAPYGDQNELPEPKMFTTGWSLPKKPDQIVEMRKRPFQVAATGTIEYQYFVVDPGFVEDKWVAAAQVLPGNPSVVHHSIVFVRPPDGGRFRGIGWLSAYVPGQRPIKLESNQARLVPAGSKLVFQQHYTPNGKLQTDITKIGLVFADELDVDEEVMTLAGLDQEFEIPPNTANHVVRAKVRGLPKNGKLLTVTPHMHLRGKSFRAYGDSADNHRILCDVPNYDFNWQHSYEFVQPIDLSTLNSIHFDVAFDNSRNNPVNPNANERVTWGDQTDEEMAVAFFDVAVPRKEIDPKRVDLTLKPSSGGSDSSDKVIRPKSEKVAAFVDKYFEKFDRNSDGAIERAELPISTRSFSFSQFDLNGNQELSRNELIQVTNRRMK